MFREAIALNFSLWMLKFSIATYKLPRVLRIGRVYNKMVVALRGITAGSGMATT